MHSELLAGFLSAWVVIYVAVAIYCAWSFARRMRDTEALLFGLFSVALAVHNLGAATSYITGDLAGFHAGFALSATGQIAATALLVPFVLEHAQVRRIARLLVPFYVVAAGFAGASLFGYVYHFEHVAEAGELSTLVAEVAVPVPIVAVPLAVFSAGTVLFATAVLGRAFFQGGVEAFASMLGVSLLSITVIHDGLWAFGLDPGITMAPFGYSAFVLGVIVTLLWRYGTVRRELERRASELNRRSKELTKANDELREAQSELVKKEQLAAVGELSAVVAHEVRNPLAIINNSVATLRRAGLGIEDRDTLLNILEEESSRLNRLVGDMLVFARPIVVERQHVSVRDLVLRAMRLAQARPDVSVDLVEPAATPKIWADAGLLRQAIENLVTNALDAMSSGGTLTLTLVPSKAASVPGLELQIQDTGEGMDTAVRSRAFDPFFTTRQSGTGLGLAIVSRIIDAHGGRLTVRSAAGAGTAMHMFMPVASEEAMQQRMRQHDSNPPRSTPVPPMPLELRQALGERSGTR